MSDDRVLSFTFELSAEQIATLERVQAEVFPTATLAEIAYDLFCSAIGAEQRFHEMTDNPALFV